MGNQWMAALCRGSYRRNCVLLDIWVLSMSTKLWAAGEIEEGGGGVCVQSEMADQVAKRDRPTQSNELLSNNDGQ